MTLKFWPTLFKSLNGIMLMSTHFMLKTVFRMEKQVFHTNSIRLVKFAVQLLCRTKNVLRLVLSKCVSRNSEAMRSLQRSAKRKNIFIVILQHYLPLLLLWKLVHLRFPEGMWFMMTSLFCCCMACAFTCSCHLWNF